MTIEVRDAHPDDAPALVGIELRLLRDGRGMIRGEDEVTSPEAFAAEIGRLRPPAGVAKVVVVDGVVAGNGYVQRMGRTRTAHVATLWLQVDPPRQGRGAGRALCEALVGWADANDVRRVQLLVRADNDRAIRLYRSLGFATEARRVGVWAGADGALRDDLVMARFSGVPIAAHKAAAAIVRTDRGRPEICVFAHPSAGWQLPKGTVEAGEDPADAVLREVAEETGLDARHVAPLGSWTAASPPAEMQRWHGFLLAPRPGAPDRWEHRAVGSPEEDGLVFALRWIPLDAETVHVLPPLFHEIVWRALAATAGR